MIREGDLDRDKEEPDSLTVLSVDLQVTFTVWYKTAVLHLGRDGFLFHTVIRSIQSELDVCGASLVGVIRCPVSGENVLCRCTLLRDLPSDWAAGQCLHCSTAHSLSFEWQEVGKQLLPMCFSSYALCSHKHD